ncbi:hypothetical protein [Cryobacterium sp. GrIS_2_6]|uniref:hypothetical protein n=1 Tax=Cryobacterium sp. GrIS_2_6 TaxID=3162785 RepID=UPI002E055DB7|nr:hypothetical protein [Cryobacterium psychrotolerans]MEC5149281.1 hypothetical protein [Cryobacterium psychrotolerans]MEC5149360.1 hypothetical protein [Cryobacterium psychrotolerans]
MKYVLLTLAAIVVLVGAWFGYWALAQANQTAQYGVNTNGQQYQSGLVSQERDRIAGYDKALDPAQKAQIKVTFCQVFPDLKPAPTDLVQANARICF